MTLREYLTGRADCVLVYHVDGEKRAHHHIATTSDLGACAALGLLDRSGRLVDGGRIWMLDGSAHRALGDVLRHVAAYSDASIVWAIRNGRSPRYV